MLLRMMKQLLCCFGASGEDVVRESLVPTFKAQVRTHVPLAKAPMLIQPLPPLPSPCSSVASVVLTPSSAPAVEVTLPVVVAAQALVAVEDILGSALPPALTTIISGVERLTALPISINPSLLSPPSSSLPSDLGSTRVALPPTPSTPATSYTETKHADIKSLDPDPDECHDQINSQQPNRVMPGPFPFPIYASEIFAFNNTDALLLGELGSGTFATVYLAEVHEGGQQKQIAMKVCPAAEHTIWEAEVEINMHLEGTGICPMLDHGGSEEYRYISMPFARLGDLSCLWPDCPEDVRPFAAWDVMSDLFKAMNNIHSAGIVHWDLKPENILVGDHNFWIGDLGIATPVPPDELVVADRGSLGYLAPEVLRSEPAGPKADMFSLGCIYYYLLTGQRLFGSDPEENLHGLREHHFDNHPVFEGRRGNVLRCAVSCLCSDDPYDRPSASDALEMLEWVKEELNAVPAECEQHKAGNDTQLQVVQQSTNNTQAHHHGTGTTRTFTRL